MRPPWALLTYRSSCTTKAITQGHLIVLVKNIDGYSLYIECRVHLWVVSTVSLTGSGYLEDMPLGMPAGIVLHRLTKVGRPAHRGWHHPLVGILDCVSGGRAAAFTAQLPTAGCQVSSCLTLLLR